jgi:hypothetical protein
MIMIIIIIINVTLLLYWIDMSEHKDLRILNLLEEIKSNSGFW